MAFHIWRFGQLASRPEVHSAAEAAFERYTVRLLDLDGERRFRPKSLDDSHVLVAPAVGELDSTIAASMTTSRSPRQNLEPRHTYQYLKEVSALPKVPVEPAAAVGVVIGRAAHLEALEIELESAGPSAARRRPVAAAVVNCEPTTS